MNNACSLRDLEETDIPMLLSWWNDPEIQFALGHWRPNWSAEAIQRYLQASGASLRIWMIESPQGEAIGTAEFFQWIAPQAKAELRIVLGEKGWWKKGVGNDLTRHLLMQGFGAMKLQRISARIPSYNERAQHLAESTGFQLEGRLRNSLLIHNKRYDELLYSITPDNLPTGAEIPSV